LLCSLSATWISRILLASASCIFSMYLFFYSAKVSSCSFFLT
jgi:hypothetical protein